MKTLLSSLIVLLVLQAGAATAISLVTVTVNDENEHLLADTRGNTLYVFDMDQGQKVPACTSKCSEIWPPYLLTADEAKSLAAPLGSIVRDNKTVQLTYSGRPVYGYAYDRGPAADAGDGVGGVWHYIEVK